MKRRKIKMAETIQLMVEGGKATPNAAVAQKLGPMGINIGEVMNQVNEKTADFKGMQVPVKIKINTKAKKVEDIEVGTPPTTQLIKKELGLEKGSGQPDKEKVANISVEQCIKIAKMKMEGMYTFDLKKAVKSVAGSCNSLGVLVEGKKSSEFVKAVESGKYDAEIKEGRVEVPEGKKEVLEKQLEVVQKKLVKEAEKLKAAKEEKKEEAKEGEAKEGEKKEEAKEGEKKDVKKEEKKEAKKGEKKKK